MIKLAFPKKYIGITQGYHSKHHGIDIGWSNIDGGQNAYLLASYDGVVRIVRNDYKTNDKTGSSYGNYVKIDHGSGVSTLVAHLQYNSVVVKVGQKVKRGDKLGKIGNTGHSFGTHCHYEVFINNKKVNPLDYTYLYPDQTAHADTLREYKIKKYVPLTSVKRDENKNQLKTLEKMNVREKADINSNSNDTTGIGEIYNYYDIVAKNDYKWYKIGDNMWLAQNKEETYLEILTKKEKEDDILQEKINKLEKDIYTLTQINEKLNITINELKNRNKINTEIIDELNEKISNKDKTIDELSTYKFEYNVTETKRYYIKLYENEKLIIR